MPSYEDLKKWDFEYFWHPFTQMKEYMERDPVIVERGDGVFLYDVKGNKYIDGISSLWVNIHGHNREELNQAIGEQLSKIAHSTTLGISNVPAILLAKKLVEITPKRLRKVFFSDTGACAMEIGIKVAYHYWQNLGVKGKRKFLSVRNGYHGDTIGAMSVGGIDLFHSIYKPLLFENYLAPSPYCYRCELNANPATCGLLCLEKLDEIAKKHKDELCAIVCESAVQAAGGMIVLPQGYMKGLREIADRYGLLLVLDEVAVGFGRTGRMWGCEHENVEPDIMAIAKGLTGGYLPVAATLVTD
ncbi:MAG: aspartate aminotransferase family protein, partial [Thermosulfidibacteraceae bacterium]